MTLIEVLAALMLMSSILVALITARGRLLSQHTQAMAKQEAVRVADELLATWWNTDPPAIPMEGEGDVLGHPGWVWRTSEVGLVAEGLPVQTIRLAIIDERNPSDPNELVRVDVLAPTSGSPDPPSDRLVALDAVVLQGSEGRP